MEGNYMKRFLFAAFLIALIVLMPSCGDKQAAAGTDSSKSPQKQAIRLTKSRLTMEQGASMTIKLKGAKAGKVKWS